MTIGLYLDGLRADAEEAFVDTCTITDPTATSDRGPLDEETGEYAEGSTPPPVYQGRCKVKVATVTAAEVDASGQTRVRYELQLHLPVTGSEAVRAGHTALIDVATHDAALQGRRFRISGLHHETFATARRLEVVEI